MLLKSTVSVTLLLLACATLRAEVLVTVPAADSSSSPSSQGIVAGGLWSSDFNVSWNITQSGANYHYVYKIYNDSNRTLSYPVSFLLLEVSPDITSSNVNSLITMTKGSIISGPATYTAGSSDPNLPGPIYAVDFQLASSSTGQVLDFTTTRPPVWGDFFAQGPLTVKYAYDTNFGTNPTNSTTDFSMWVPTVGAAVPVPEPATILILGSCCAMAMAAKRRAKNRC